MSDDLERAEVLIDQDRYDLAEEHLMRALAADPDDEAALAMLAACRLAREDYDGAQHYAERAVQLDPQSAPAHQVLGLILTARNDLNAAEAEARECISLEPGEADGPALLADVLTRKEDWGEALAAANRALEIEPDHVGAANDRALALRMLGREDDQVDTLRAALALEPDNSTTHANLGFAFALRGETKEALTHLRESLRLDPTDEFAREGIIKALRHAFPPLLWGMRYRLWLSRGSRRRRLLVGLFVGLGLYMLAFPPAGLMPAGFPNMTVFWGLMGVLHLGTVAPFFADFVLQFHPLGRLVLLPRARMTAWLVTASTFIGLAGLSSVFWPGMYLSNYAFWMGALALFMAYPAVAVGRFDWGWPLRAARAAALVAAALWLASAIAPFAGGEDIFFSLWVPCAYACGACVLLSALLQDVKPRR